MHNLAGFMCFLIVKGNPRDTWSGTKVIPSGGTIRQPQRVSSWLIAELLNNFVEMAHKQNSMSERQQHKIRTAMRQNMSCAGRRFEELDKRLIQTS